jgi:flagellar motor switch protein FliG
MTGQEKAALLLLQLPAPDVDGILGHLGADRSERLRAQMQHFREAPPPADVVDQLLNDLEQIMREQTAAVAESPLP